LRTLISNEDISEIRSLTNDQLKNLAHELYFYLSDLKV